MTEVYAVCDPKPGDILRINAGAYFHYGIYVGDDKVVEFGSAADPKSNRENVRVQLVSIDEFMMTGGFLEVRKLSLAEKLKKRSDKEIVRIALSRLGEGGYDLFKNNCKQFCESCVFKK